MQGGGSALVQAWDLCPHPSPRLEREAKFPLPSIWLPAAGGKPYSLQLKAVGSPG